MQSSPAGKEQEPSQRETHCPSLLFPVPLPRGREAPTTSVFPPSQPPVVSLIKAAWNPSPCCVRGWLCASSRWGGRPWHLVP